MKNLERLSAMNGESTVPGYIALEFERVAGEVCARAKLDYEQHFMQIHDLVHHFQEEWRRGDEEGLGKEEAKDRALKSLDDFSQLARSLRDPWFIRLFSYARCQWVRLLFFVAAYMFSSWLSMVRTHLVPMMAIRAGALSPDVAHDAAFTSLGDALVPLGTQFFTEGVGSFFLGLSAAASAVALRFTWVERHAVVRQVLSLFVIIGGVCLFAVPAQSSWMVVERHMMGRMFPVFLALHIMAVIFGWFGVVCLIFEVYGTRPLMRRFLAILHRSTIGAGWKGKWATVVILGTALIGLATAVWPPIKDYLQYRSISANPKFFKPLRVRMIMSGRKLVEDAEILGAGDQLFGVLEDQFTYGWPPTKRAEVASSPAKHVFLNLAVFRGTNYVGNVTLTEQVPFLINALEPTSGDGAVSELLITPTGDERANNWVRQLKESKQALSPVQRP